MGQNKAIHAKKQMSPVQIKTRLQQIRYKHGANRPDLNRDLIQLEEDIMGRKKWIEEHLTPSGIEFREFTEPDWDTFQGAEGPSVFQKPLIAEVSTGSWPYTAPTAAIIVDNSGIQIHDIDGHSWGMFNGFENGMKMADRLAKPLNMDQMEKLGFTRL